jgi:predicted AlkP superfamily pyrophosphatase or phosphodiesterase
VSIGTVALGLAVIPANAQLVDPDPVRKLIVVSWDGNADWVVDRLLALDRLPNLRRLMDRGVHADQVSPANPSKTAPGHAALWTGTFSDMNGVSGNAVPLLPRSEHTILETTDATVEASTR